MKIWGLLGNVDQEVDKRGMEFYDRVYQTGIPGIELQLVLLDYLEIDVMASSSLKIRYRGQELPLPDYYWSMITNTDSLIVEKLLSRAGVKSILDLDEFDAARSKLLTYERFAMGGIPFPKTRLFFRHTGFASLSEEFGLPFVVKPDDGYAGIGVALIRGEEDYIAYGKTMQQGVPYMAQEYISTSRGRDCRVVMMGDRFVYSVIRQAGDPDEFRSNTHRGGSSTFTTPDDKALEIAKAASLCFDLPALAVDLLYAEDGYKVAEVNAFPGVPKQFRGQILQGVIAYFNQRMRQAEGR